MDEGNVTSEEQSAVDYYNKNIQSYIERTFQVEMEDFQNRFLQYLPPKARILDAGCGPGRDVLAFTKKGYTVLGFDAAEEMVKYVNRQLGLLAVRGFFHEMEFSEAFEGVWASASLVHVPPSVLADVLQKLWKALTPNGILGISFKEGVGVKREGDRTFTYMNKESLSPYLNSFDIVDQWIHTPKEGVNLVPCQWFNTIARKR
jgi:SAM-dependent methyltransferase